MGNFLNAKKRIMLCGMAALFTGLQGVAKANGRGGICNGCAACTGNCPGAKLLSTAAVVQDSNYYASKKKEIMQEFDMHEPFIQKELGKSFDVKTLAVIMKQIRSQYSNLILQLPYIGGEKNSLTGNLVTCTTYLSAYKVLKNYKMPVNKIGQMAYSVTVNELTSFYSKQDRDKSGKEQFLKNYIDMLKAGAQESQKKKYAADWVYKVVDGDKKNFDYGIDYTECGVVKFFHKQKADEFIPYMCKLDFAISDMFGLGLKRTVTIAGGKGKCDFRYKHK